ncbi:Putative HTH-type transcriptional regulator [Corynebacterium occultum]|uniref:HTH-type transcriptional regulator n=1 Tax=Corynebacterium occultum TaxID=2675219 RepID=A0A6B8VR77_9CORY|nr:LuxR C-terminal-related transcriptional regulator [Corynebacterium occultum]QGU06613.1 Putative HTH-type transcriptional regulator [Corynebacterium occultum]
MSRSIGSLNRGSALGRAALTSFVGRRRELSEAKAKLVASRLVTLTGPGGVGKTRIALELADRVKKAFKDGVWLIELDSLSTGDRVASAVATTLSVPDQTNRVALDRVMDYLRDKEILLVLDNCEHVLQDAAEVADALLTAAPKIRILATSREPLHIAAEHVCVVPPLTTPPWDELEAGGIEHFEAVSLLVDRARQLVPDFSVTPDNQEVIAQLCIRLDGIPLAIELAVARLRTLSPDQLLDRLDQRFQLLNRGDRAVLPRQQTLQALIDWSYGLCSKPEQLLWRRLAIFPDVFDLDAAEYVCGFGELGRGEVLDLLDQLVSKSILQTDRAANQVRYRQLMTVREYGTLLLTDDGEEHELRRRHRDHYLNRAEERVAAWWGPLQAESLNITRAERPNLIAALEWSLGSECEYDTAARLAVALRYHWIAGGFLSDGRAWLERILRQSELSLPARGNASWVAGWVALIQGDHEDAAKHLEVSLAAGQSLEDSEMAVFAQHWQALHLLFTGDLEGAIGLFTEVVADHGKHDRPADQLTAIFQLGMARSFNGQSEEGLRISVSALKISERDGERWNCAYLWWIVGLCHWQLGDFPAAREAAFRALRIQQDFQDAICTAMSIELLSWVAVSTSDFERGKELAEAAESVWQGLGTEISAFGPHIAKAAAGSAAKFQKALGAKNSPKTVGKQRLSKAEAIAVALGKKPRVTQNLDRGVENNPLTKREMEIAELVSQGLTNRQIAGKLVLSHRTVDGHVERIFTKLNFTSRVQLVTWVESLRQAPQAIAM